MPSETIYPGALVKINCLAENLAGTAIDPTTLTCKIRKPDRTVTTYVYGTDVELVKSATGTYYVYFSVTLDGVHRYRFSSTGTGQAANEAEFEVLPSDFS